MSNRAGPSDVNEAQEDDESDNKETRDVRAALQMAVLQIIIKEDRIHRTRTTPGAIRALSELVYQYVTNRLAPDLYQFSDHASRKSTIAVDDVALVLRKVPHLQEQLMGNLNIKKAPTNESNKSNQSNRRSSSASARSRQETAKSTANQNTRRPITTNLLSSSSSSNDDDSSIDIAKNKEKNRPIAVPRARSASTSPTVEQRKPTPLKTALSLKKAPPTYSQNKRRLDQLLNDSSSSEDELPDFMKPITKKKSPAKDLGSPLLPSPKRAASPPKRSHQSQVMEILNQYSSDSALSNDSEMAAAIATKATPAASKKPNYDSDDDSDDDILAHPSKKRTQKVVDGSSSSSSSSQEDDDNPGLPNTKNDDDDSF
ncbi:unnamed protein product [Cylindrotheca closterium]|uniref:Uncharacterized protein n=1 Tax=Cylindrotheca closterium TaxID=2856 RepID=A0AAD2JML2_9STRA|nr:unnamed protein product [Cylindrotheca closterium]